MIAIQLLIYTADSLRSTLTEPYRVNRLCSSIKIIICSIGCSDHVWPTFKVISVTN